MSERSDDAAWHWLAPDGKAAHGSDSELRDKLASRALPPSTRVWRIGWAEWLPANRVTELANSVPPGTKLTPREPRLDPAQTAPPDPKHTEALRPSQAPPRVQASALRPAKPPLPGSLGQAASRTPAGLPPASERAPVARPLPPRVGASPAAPAAEAKAPSTLRPPSAVPPPPARSSVIPAPAHAPAPPPRSAPSHSPVVVAPVDSEVIAHAAGADDADVVEADDIGAVLTDPPAKVPGESSLPPIAPNPVPGDIEPLPSFRASAPPPVLPLPTAPPSLSAPTPPAVGNLRVALVVVSLIAAGLVVLLLLTLALSSGEDSAPRASSSAAAPSSAQKSAQARGCSLAVPAAKLAGSIERSVAPNLLTLEDGRVAVGFAAKPTQASGLVVNLATLDAQSSFEEQGQSAVKNVTPQLAGKLGFAVDREDGPLSSPRTIDAPGRVVLGFSKDGLARSTANHAGELLWKTSVEKVTEPRSARAGNKGYLVTFRSGGLGGDVIAGWLNTDLAKLGSFEVLPAGVRFVGTPAVAAHPEAALVAFAGREQESADWRIRFMRSEPTALPRAASDFALPPGGPGGGAIAPSLATFDKDRWLVQWTEGGAGQYQVRVQQLTAELAPVGEPVLASPKGASAGQGAIWVVGKRALSLFVLTVGGYDELWGASLECH